MVEDPWGEEPAWARDDAEGEAVHDDDVDEDGITWFGAQHVVALLDCSATMFTPCIDWPQEADPRRRISPMDAALIACERLARNRVLQVATQKTGKRDGVGVLLYGTRTHDDDDDEDEDNEQLTEQKSSTQTLVELNPPGVQQIRILRSCLHDPICGLKRNIQKEFENFDDDSGLGRKLRTAIQEANKAYLEAKFVQNPRKLTHKNPGDLKSIWIFTNHDNPHQGRDDEKRQLAQIITDLAEGGTDFVVWSLPKADGGVFDPRLLYSHLQCLVHAPPTFDMGEMLENICHQAKKPRRVLCLPMILPDWKAHKEEPGIMVNFYKIVQEQKKPQPKWINQATKQETERVTQTIIKDTGEVVKTSGGGDTVAESSFGLDRILHFANFGMDRVLFSPDDVALIKKASSPGTGTASLIILGFKRQDAIPITSTVDKTYFIYPTDEKEEGSIDAFANLHAAMLRKNVVAIGEMLNRVTSGSRIVAIFPQAEQKVMEDGYEEQITPPGMIVVNLPFEDDVRKMEPDSSAMISAESRVEEAVDLVRHQKIESIEFGINFENASIAKFWRYVEAVALETTIPTKEQHETELNEMEVLNAAGAQIEAFRDSLPPDVKTEKKAKDLPVKRKAVEVFDDESGLDWVRLYSSGSISTCKVDDLKSYLKSIGSRTGGRKGDLVIRVSQSISDRLLSGDLVQD